MDNYLKSADQYGRKFLQSIPNRLILANLSCGLTSLLMATSGYYRLSSLFILLAGTCCFFEDRARRHNRIKLDVNIQLDSFADMISFGVAPIILAHSIKHYSFLMTIAFIGFPLAGAWRTAKFHNQPKSDYILGLPLSVSGIVIALLAFFSLVSPFVMIILSLLMISSLEIPKP
ncbi:hypothetical protein I4U23_000273 [Adineta vaga]|nr:hypothetical protein I4U23_000273 [Adineta vaga]